MKTKYSIIVSCFLIGLSLFSCKDLDEMNINPNGVDPNQADVSLLLGTVITGTGNTMNGYGGLGDISGVMQHIQQDGWAGGVNAYDWTANEWDGFYENLRNAKEMLRKADEAGNDFYKGAAKVFLAYNFGAIADFWGDAPFWSDSPADAPFWSKYSAAPYLEGICADDGIMKPRYDKQRDIYIGVIELLKEANTLFSQPQSAYIINPDQDPLYNGDVAKWRKFANSLRLRYYLRISTKERDIAETGIKEILGDPAQYPLILTPADDAAYACIGATTGNSWRTTTVFSKTIDSEYLRRKMCQTLIDKMWPTHNDPTRAKDPRLGVWANKVETPLKLDLTKDVEFDQIIDGVRVIGDSVSTRWERTNGGIQKHKLNYDTDYIGYPPAWTDGTLYVYNLNMPGGQGRYNPHASQLGSLYEKAADPLLKARMLSAAEMQFCLAEIAYNGWGGDAKEHYNAAIRVSLETWGVSSGYNDFITHPDIAYNETLEQIIEQKWIASWTAACEAWFDWRRTGFPVLAEGTRTKNPVPPIRFYYGTKELSYNRDNLEVAIDRLEPTPQPFSEPGNTKNSAWSRMWLLQETGKPW